MLLVLYFCRLLFDEKKFIAVDIPVFLVFSVVLEVLFVAVIGQYDDDVELNRVLMFSLLLLLLPLLALLLIVV